MAGNHQLWALDLAAGEVRRFAGTGREALDDGTLERSALAQPSGLALANARLYFADSETSSVRAADINADRVQTIVGEGLFEFGDRDGRGSEVRLQHCLDVACDDGLLYVADAYNNKIKLIEPATRSSKPSWEPARQACRTDRARRHASGSRAASAYPAADCTSRIRTTTLSA